MIKADELKSLCEKYAIQLEGLEKNKFELNCTNETITFWLKSEIWSISSDEHPRRTSKGVANLELYLNDSNYDCFTPKPRTKPSREPVEPLCKIVDEYVAKLSKEHGLKVIKLSETHLRIKLPNNSYVDYWPSKQRWRPETQNRKQKANSGFSSLLAYLKRSEV
ncbi:hypothetical protein M3899_003332 [Vibrio parahaemolyticus]|nr:hypothetical protein [Vibrio parahaemolyticus]